MTYKILLVDDEPDILEFMSYNLLREGYEVHVASNGREAIDKALEVMPHIILLDVMMPEMDGIQACIELRKRPEFSETLIVFLSALGEDSSQLKGFDVGADDYITKPIKVKLLISRIQAMLKRINVDKKKSSDNAQKERSIIINKERYVVIKDGRELVLPRKEFNLLALLYSKPKKVFAREEIYSSVWGNDVIVGDRTIDVHIRKLRERIGSQHIVTIKGVGYKYED